MRKSAEQSNEMSMNFQAKEYGKAKESRISYGSFKAQALKAANLNNDLYLSRSRRQAS
ncbi:hypothetical protein AB434_2029 [Heyndrickxia coagulans]|uniref:Uncharacterized protein n=1 Tax=Heyndrickxia coagulans TaxID=1398 RepID=A0AAN0WD40_HEYCO|nr:hypothetical protein SB48_HM08orf05265 [Heyndrickxia coagulans]AKN54434.1 hypothetical protein AB434_2029 [Heyndrickxia coagulans]